MPWKPVAGVVATAGLVNSRSGATHRPIETFESRLGNVALNLGVHHGSDLAFSETPNYLKTGLDAAKGVSSALAGHLYDYGKGYLVHGNDYDYDAPIPFRERVQGDLGNKILDHAGKQIAHGAATLANTAIHSANAYLPSPPPRRYLRGATPHLSGIRQVSPVSVPDAPLASNTVKGFTADAVNEIKSEVGAVIGRAKAFPGEASARYKQSIDPHSPYRGDIQAYDKANDREEALDAMWNN